MASFNSGDLKEIGPVIPVKLWAPVELQSTVPPIETLITIDTAYPYNFIQEGVATRLGLTPHRTVKITTPTKYVSECDVYNVRLEFPEGPWLQLHVAEVPFLVHGSVRIGCMLGRGFLSVCSFTYDGPSNAFSLEYKW